jgi:hypothetical protein
LFIINGRSGCFDLRIAQYRAISAGQRSNLTLMADDFVAAGVFAIRLQAFVFGKARAFVLTEFLYDLGIFWIVLLPFPISAIAATIE